MSPHADLFNRALQHHQAGQLPQAEHLYRQILQMEPRHADALHLLGVLAYQVGRYDVSVDYVRRAIAVDPSSGDYHCNLGAAYRGLGRLGEAAACFERALRLKPDCAEACFNLGTVREGQGDLDAAAAYYQQALRLRPDADAHYNLANLLLVRNKPAEAIAHCRQALRLRPDHADTYNSLGTALNLEGQVDESAASFRAALRLKPDFAEAYNNLGSVLLRQGLKDDGLDCYRQALRIRPDYVSAYNNLGAALFYQGRLAEAVDCYRQAMRCQPGYTLAHSNFLQTLNYDPQADADVVFAEHCRFGDLHDRLPSPVAFADWDRNPQRRLRIGYVSPDLRRHPVVRYLEPVLAHHDPQQVHITCYAEVTMPDAVTTRLQQLVPQWRWTCGRPAAEVAAWIRADGIDILVDLAGHTGNNRLDVFALKPAPIQVTWLGYMNTTGLRTMDYRLTDAATDPPGQPVRDTEELYRLPGGMACFAPPADAPALSSLPARRTGQLTFGALHTLTKLNSAVFDLWCRVLHALPGARLLMFRDTLVGQAREFVRQQFLDRGIAADRLDLRQGSSAPGYLSVYDEIDLTLDVFPYTGGTTTCESLWMGAPVLSLSGVRPAARGSAGVLACVGLRDWIVQTPEAYVALAERWASDLYGLAAVRAGLRERMRTTLCDARRFTRELEDAYRTMWRRWCAKAV